MIKSITTTMNRLQLLKTATSKACRPRSNNHKRTMIHLSAADHRHISLDRKRDDNIVRRQVDEEEVVFPTAHMMGSGGSNSSGGSGSNYYSSSSSGATKVQWLSLLPLTLIAPLYYLYKKKCVYEDEHYDTTTDLKNVTTSKRTPSVVDQLLEELYALNVEAQNIQNEISNLSLRAMASSSTPTSPSILEEGSSDAVQIQNELQYTVEMYRGIIHHMSLVMDRIGRMSDEEYASSGLVLAQLHRSDIGYEVLRNCILLNLNSKAFLRESPRNENTNLHVQIDLERMHFAAMMTLNRLAALGDDYAHKITSNKLLGPCFNTLLRVQSPSLRQVASDLLCHLSDHDTTHDNLIEWVTTFRFMVESRSDLAMYTAAYVITRMFCNEKMRPLLSQTQFLPYTNLLGEIFENSTAKSTRTYASFGVLLAQGKIKQLRFLKEKERNAQILDKLQKMMFIVGTSFAWSALRFRLMKGRPLSANYGQIAQSTIAASALGGTLIARDEIKQWLTKREHDKFVGYSGSKDDVALKLQHTSVPPVSISHASIVALLQILALKSGIPFIMVPYLIHMLYMELHPKDSKAHPYKLHWEHLLRNFSEVLFRRALTSQ